MGIELFKEDGTFTWPSGFTEAVVVCVGGGGGGGEDSGGVGGGGGGGGAVSASLVTKTASSAAITVGAGGAAETAGGDSSFVQGVTTNVLAKGGSAGSGATPGVGGLASAGTGTDKVDGGTGGTGKNNFGAGGGSSGGWTDSGAIGGNTGEDAPDPGNPELTGAGAQAPSGGGDGGNGGDNGADGAAGQYPGGGGGGAGRDGAAGVGAAGRVVVFWDRDIGHSFCCCGVCEVGSDVKVVLPRTITLAFALSPSTDFEEQLVNNGDPCGSHDATTTDDCYPFPTDPEDVLTTEESVPFGVFTAVADNTLISMINAVGSVPMRAISAGTDGSGCCVVVYQIDSKDAYADQPPEDGVLLLGSTPIPTRTVDQPAVASCSGDNDTPAGITTIEGAETILRITATITICPNYTYLVEVSGVVTCYKAQTNPAVHSNPGTFYDSRTLTFALSGSGTVPSPESWQSFLADLALARVGSGVVFGHLENLFIETPHLAGDSIVSACNQAVSMSTDFGGEEISTGVWLEGGRGFTLAAPGYQELFHGYDDVTGSIS